MCARARKLEGERKSDFVIFTQKRVLYECDRRGIYAIFYLHIQGIKTDFKAVFLTRGAPNVRFGGLSAAAAVWTGIFLILPKRDAIGGRFFIYNEKICIFLAKGIYKRKNLC